MVCFMVPIHERISSRKRRHEGEDQFDGQIGDGKVGRDVKLGIWGKMIFEWWIHVKTHAEGISVFNFDQCLILTKSEPILSSLLLE